MGCFESKKKLIQQWKQVQLFGLGGEFVMFKGMQWSINFLKNPNNLIMQKVHQDKIISGFNNHAHLLATQI